MSLWTETPAERQKRLEDEVMGRKRRAVDAVNGGAAEDPEKKRRKKEEAQIKREVDEYNVRMFHSLAPTRFLTWPSFTEETPWSFIG
jgi:hypothetical protein